MPHCRIRRSEQSARVAHRKEWKGSPTQNYIGKCGDLGPCRQRERQRQGPGGQHEVETENLDLTRELGSERQRGSRGAEDFG